MTTDLERPGAIIVHVLEHNAMGAIRHDRGYVIAGDRRIPIWKCSANGGRACQGHGVKAPTRLREQPCKRAGHPVSERRTNGSGHSYCTACARDGYRERKAA
jgi:hypothetical protein